MKLTKNLVAIVSSLWTRFSIKKKLYANVHTDVIPSFPLFTYFHILKKLPSSQPRWLMAVCSCHVTYAFQSDSTHYSCLNVKELLASRRREFWSLSDCNWSRTQNHLLRKRTLNHFAKLAIWPNGWVFI